jgi:hypothetical protein
MLRPGNTFEIAYQHPDLRRLRKGLMLELIGIDADAPVSPVDIHTHINLLTREIEFANVIHGK